MKVLIAYFKSETNEHSRSLMTFDKFIFKYGDEMLDACYVKDLFDSNDIELIPSIYANGHPHGLITYDVYEFIRNKILNDVKTHIHEIDGIFLFLHGASKVIDLPGGSAEHDIVREIRKVTGPYLPMAMVMDPHGNLSDELADNVNILRCYRQSPHTDIRETFLFTAEKFIDYLKNRRYTKPVYLKVPIIIGGEKSVSTDEPMLSINHMCDEIEKDSRIMSASFHIGYLRHDGDKLGCSAVVVPNDEKDTDYAREMCIKLQKYVFSKRKEFHYHGNTAEPLDALDQAINSPLTPIFITDSGDNCGSGADGFNTYLLSELIKKGQFNNKQYLFSGIVDKNSFAYLNQKEVGSEVDFNLGANADIYSAPVHITGTITAKGIGSSLYSHKKSIGTVITVKMKDCPVSVVVEWDSIQYVDMDQFVQSNLNIGDYDVIFVKEGYISDDYAKYGKLAIMAFTQGPTYQRSENLQFKLIKRPMYPYDDFEL